MRWFALALLCAVQFMVVLDVAIVNVALPSIQLDLGFSQENLQWVISAYALVFGGFMLLGGRLADIIGRRRVFMAGLVIFSVGSLLCGLASSDEFLIGARALQGLGAATITPSALSILTTMFAEGRERNIALGVWGAVGGFGAAAGVLLGGILTDLLSWEWIFFVNVPVGVAGLALAPVLLVESRETHGQSHDVPGAVLVTSALTLLVLAITQGQQWGWGSAATIGVFVAAAALLAAFTLWERRQREPLVPFSIFRLQTLAAANVAGLILGTALFSMFLMLTLYMQQVLGYSALETGFAYLAVAGTAIVWANLAAAAVNRVGVKPSLILGMSLLTVGLLLFTQVSVGGSYWIDLFPGFLVLGVAIPFAFVPITIAALAGTKPEEAGLASGLINTSQQIGGAVGIAVLSTIAVSTTDNKVASGTRPSAALTDGFVNAFWAGAAIAFVGVLVSVFLVRGRDLRALEATLSSTAAEEARSANRPGSGPAIPKGGTMKYMLLIYQGTAPTPRSPDGWAHLSDGERTAIFGAYQGINQTPGVTPGVVLQPAEQTAITVRIENDKTQTIEGPFVPVEQALDGYLMFETDDADAAIELATRIPAARLGGAVEIRPVVES